jgi:hypothetical protein
MAEKPILQIFHNRRDILVNNLKKKSFKKFKMAAELKMEVKTSFFSESMWKSYLV